MKEFKFEVERRVYGWLVDRVNVKAETEKEALEKLKQISEDATINGWDENDVNLETSEFDYLTVSYPTIEKNNGATVFVNHLDSCLGWNNQNN